MYGQYFAHIHLLKLYTFLWYMDIIEILNQYANLLSFFSSLLMLIVTAVYVYFTKRQATSASDSFFESITQFRESKQPCLIPTVKSVSGIAFDTSTDIRIQFTFNYELENIGDSPALSVNTIAKMHLKYSKESEVVAHLMPKYKHFVQVQSKEASSFHFETNEFRSILEDIQISSVKNRKRIEINPCQTPYSGPILQISVFYKNLMGQWYETLLEQELLDIKRLVNEKGEIRKKGEVLEYTYDQEIVDQNINDGDRFKGYMINPAYSNLTRRKITEHDVQTILNQYSNPVTI